MKIIFCIFIIFLNSLCFSQFAGGNGTLEDPYQIATAEHLNNIRYNLTSHYIQTADIDLGVAPWNEGEGWEPIGDYYWTNPSISFSGTYNGDNYQIKNMMIKRPEKSYVGLFGASLNSIFQNIHLKDINIIGSSETGGLVGLQNSDNVSELIKNCSVTGYVEAKAYVGMLFGETVYAEIVDCYSIGEMAITHDGTNIAGGLVGSFQCGSILNSYSIVTISSQGNIVGGLIGQAVFLEYIRDCYSIVNIKNALNTTGGLFGSVSASSISNTIIENCFVKGEINSLDYRIGGIFGYSAGFNYDEITYPIQYKNCFTDVVMNGVTHTGGFGGITYNYISIVNCYSKGIVTGSSNVGGFIGYMDSPETTNISNCYWDMDASGLLTSDGGEGRTTDEMTYPYATNTYDNWDFTDIWREDTKNINGGYPYLIWTETGIEWDEDIVLAKGFELYQNYPNPFNPSTQIKFAIAKTAVVKLSVYNINGQLVSELAKGVKNAGCHIVDFDGRDLNSGVYYYTLSVDGKNITKKMIILK
ncbi:MAG: T9SS type A sorting domain-containing protein [Candidatus Delongbacteria bacterium]|nr:T9SS type A sorting domain-containing protein [Candidatus Delongbacteria bacterium]MCG2761202.1 T9SS type A sorting domain-containing protein [Candidatus Delongbacteria bacterium]